MSHRIESPEAGVVVPMRAAVSEGRATADASKAAPSRRPALTTAAGLVSATASAWRVRLAPALGVVSPQGEVRRTWSRGPRR